MIKHGIIVAHLLPVVESREKRPCKWRIPQSRENAVLYYVFKVREKSNFLTVRPAKS